MLLKKREKATDGLHKHLEFMKTKTCEKNYFNLINLLTKT